MEFFRPAFCIFGWTFFGRNQTLRKLFDNLKFKGGGENCPRLPPHPLRRHCGILVRWPQIFFYNFPATQNLRKWHFHFLLFLSTTPLTSCYISWMAAMEWKLGGELHVAITSGQQLTCLRSVLAVPRGPHTKSAVPWMWRPPSSHVSNGDRQISGVARQIDIWITIATRRQDRRLRKSPACKAFRQTPNQGYHWRCELKLWGGG